MSAKLTRSELADLPISPRARMLAELDYLPHDRLDQLTRERVAMLITIAGGRLVPVGEVLRALWPDASTATANRSFRRLITAIADARVHVFVQVSGAKSSGLARLVHVMPRPSAVEMGIPTDTREAPL